MFDVIVVGGGPAGLAAALTLGRSRRTTLLLDAGEPRNAPAAAVHNFLSRDGTAPGELRETAREQLGRYPTVELRDEAVDAAASLPGGSFEVALARGGVERARRLLLATGLADELPPIAGIAGLWGRAVFHCPYCHGFEVRGAPLAVQGSARARVRLALHLKRFSDDVVLCTDGPADFDEATQTLLERRGVPVRQERINQLLTRDGELDAICFETGPPLPRRALFADSRTVQRSELPARFGCSILADGCVEVNDFGQTTVAGIYAAGDLARRATFPVPLGAVVAAAASGTIAAGALDQEFLTLETDCPAPFAVARG